MFLRFEVVLVLIWGFFISYKREVILGFGKIYGLKV